MIDAIRGIACVFVLMVHVTFPGEFGIYIKALARFAVPFFLMNSGWFARMGDAAAELSGAKRQLRKILRMTLMVCVLHIIGNSLTSLVAGEGIYAWVLPHWKIETLINFLLFNRSKIFSSVVYYFFMLIYVYLLFLLFLYAKKKGVRVHETVMKVLIPLLLAANLYISEINSLTWYWAGNWLLTGIPFFFIGYFMREWDETHRPAGKKLALPLMAAGIAITFIEIPFGGDNVYLYAGTIITTVALYHFAAHFAGRVPGALVHFGRAYSQKIFIIHCMIYNILLAILGSTAKNTVLQWMMPVIVAVIAFGIAFLWNRGEKIWRRRKKSGAV